MPAKHGTDEHQAIYAQVARRLYVQHIAPDFAYLPSTEFYELPHFRRAYDKAVQLTAGFTRVSVDELAASIRQAPLILLPLRVITGLTRAEFSASTILVAKPLGLRPLSTSKVDSMEKRSTSVTALQAQVAAETLSQIMIGSLFGDPPGNFKSKQDKPDTVLGWASVQDYAAEGVPYSVFLHQRHYGGAFRQILDALSEVRGSLLEDAVESLFQSSGIPYVRTSSGNQGDIAARFEITVLPTPDFVVFDSSDNVRGMLECKLTNDGGTARDKALRFKTLHDECIRLSGVPLFAVLGGLGWTRVNDTLGPVIRHCEGRVFSVPNLADMLTVLPFPSLMGLAN